MNPSARGRSGAKLLQLLLGVLLLLPWMLPGQLSGCSAQERCTRDSDCQTGTWCDLGECKVKCRDGDCRAGYLCTTSGRCIPKSDGPVGQPEKPADRGPDGSLQDRSSRTDSGFPDVAGPDSLVPADQQAVDEAPYKYPANVCVSSQQIGPCKTDTDCDKIYVTTGKSYACVQRAWKPPPESRLCLQKCPPAKCAGAQVCRDGACQNPDPICAADADCDKMFAATGKKYVCLSAPYKAPTGTIHTCLQKCQEAKDCPGKGYDCNAGLCELARGTVLCQTDKDCDDLYHLPGKYKCIVWNWKPPTVTRWCNQKCAVDSDCPASQKCNK